jgi:transposase
MTTTHKQFKMADVTDARTKHKVATEFLTAEQASPTENHWHLNRVYGERTVNLSTVMLWVRHFKSDEIEDKDNPRNGRPAKAVRANNSCTDALIKQELNKLCQSICTVRPN